MTGGRSLSIRTASELTLMATIKPGFVEGMAEPFTYASRLRLLLSTLFKLRKTAEEQYADPYVGPLERLRVLHFVRYAIFDDDRRLLLAVSFDHSWEAYMRGLVDNAGSLLDAIFCHCTDYAGSSCSLGFSAFTRWVKEHQIPVDFFFAAESALTTDDVRYLKAYAELPVRDGGFEDFEKSAARLRVGDYPKPVASDDPQRAAEQAARALKLLAALHQLDRFFPDLGQGPHRDKAFFDGVVASLLWSADSVLTRLSARKPEQGAIHELLTFYDRLHRPAPVLEPAQPVQLAHADIQGNVIKPYAGMTHGCMVLLQCADTEAMAKLFQHLKPRIDYDDSLPANTIKTNVALTAVGLKKAGLSAAEHAAFPAEFTEGMEARAGLIGDVAAHHPESWRRPLPNWPLGVDGLPEPREGLDEPIASSAIDAVVILQVKANGVEGDHRLVADHPLRDQVHALALPGVRILRVETMRRVPLEHDPEPLIEAFGFRDGVSEPSVRTSDRAASSDDVAPGELVLGYPDARGEKQENAHSPPGQPDVFQNGTFLVVRKLAQDVASFAKLEADAAAALGASADEAAALIMGRRKDGSSMIEGAQGNAFTYAEDPHGAQCPFHAHVRRANPRRPELEDSGLRNANPRIARRSLPYGSASEPDDYGLVFMAYNARIAEQFEVIQGWLSGANPTGLYSACSDLLTGLAERRSAQHRVWVKGSAKRLPSIEKAPVRLQWGLYAFVPGRAAIERFAQASTSGAAADERAQIEAGARIIAALARLPADQARIEWKRLLENPAQRRQAIAVWAAIRARGGALTTPYGVLVGSAAEVERVLSDHTRFSVREYYERMRTAEIPLHLGMDRQVCPIQHSRPEHRSRDAIYEQEVSTGRYDAASKYNAKMYAIDTPAAFAAASAHTRAWLGGLAQQLASFAQLELAPQGGDDTRWMPIRIDLRRLAFDVMEALSAKWFGLPSGLREDFWNVSLDVFRPNPEVWVREMACASGKKIRAAFEAGPREDQAEPIDRIGAVLGFTGPTTGSFMSVMNVWQSDDQLLRLKAAWQAQSGTFDPADESSALRRALIAALQRSPVPDLLHRTALQNGMIGGERITAGDRVVVSVGSACAERPERADLLFGGNYPSKGALTHACPGQPLAIGVLLGMITALFGCAQLRYIAPLTLEASVRVRPLRTTSS